MQEKRNSIANALELHLSCTNPSIWPLKIWVACNNASHNKNTLLCQIILCEADSDRRNKSVVRHGCLLMRLRKTHPSLNLSSFYLLHTSFHSIMTSANGSICTSLALCAGNSPVTNINKYNFMKNAWTWSTRATLVSLCFSFFFSTWPLWCTHSAQVTKNIDFVSILTGWFPSKWYHARLHVGESG